MQLLIYYAILKRKKKKIDIVSVWMVMKVGWLTSKWLSDSTSLGCHCVLSWSRESVSRCNSLGALLVAWTTRADNWNWAKPEDRKPLEICSTEPDMVHLCVSISDDGLRLESVQKGSPKTVRARGKKAIDMATLRRQPRSRTASTRQDRGSCSSTASCPVFSGPYSDHEEEPPLRRQSSPLLKGSLSSLPNSTSPSPKGSLSSLQESVPCLQGSLPSLRGSLPSFRGSLSNLRGSISRLKRRSLGSLDNSSPSPSERSTSPSLQSGNGSSSDDDGSWDTNSWSSGATCLLRTPVKQDSNETSQESGGKSCTIDRASATAIPEPEIIYQNLIFSRPAAKTENKGGCAPEKTSIALRKDVGNQRVSLSSLSKNASTVSSHQCDGKTEDRRKFSQFLNEVTFRVLKNKSGLPQQQQSTLRHHNPSPPPPPPSTPSHSSLTTTLHSTAPNPPPPPPPSTSATNLWYSPTSSNLQTIKEYDLKDITSSIHQWSKTLPSCKILEPGDVLRKVKGESHSYPEQDLELCTKIQAQPSTGRLYLETDIDRVRRLDELVANGTLGKEMNEIVLDKGMERGKERENRISWERNGGFGLEKGNEREKKKESPWERDRGIEKRKKIDKGREIPCWEKDKMMERGRMKEKKVVLTSYEPPPPQSTSSGRSNPCPVFSWPEGFPRMSYRSTSLPRSVNITVSTATFKELVHLFDKIHISSRNYSGPACREFWLYILMVWDTCSWVWQPTAIRVAWDFIWGAHSNRTFPQTQCPGCIVYSTEHTLITSRNFCKILHYIQSQGVSFFLHWHVEAMVYGWWCVWKFLVIQSMVTQGNETGATGLHLIVETWKHFTCHQRGFFSSNWLMGNPRYLTLVGSLWQLKPLIKVVTWRQLWEVVKSLMKRWKDSIVGGDKWCHSPPPLLKDVFSIFT